MNTCNKKMFSINPIELVFWIIENLRSNFNHLDMKEDENYEMKKKLKITQGSELTKDIAFS